MNVNNCSTIELRKIQDGRDGCISVAEGRKQIPFDINRVYYIYDLHDKVALRGKHAHKHNEQVIFCVNGRFTLTLDDGRRQEEIVLDSPEKGIYMGVGVWHTMKDFSDNCILLVFASDPYDEQDYIRNYEDFKDYVGREAGI